MYGDHVDVLNLYMKTASGGLGTAIWTRKGSRKNSWYSGDVLVNPTSDFQVRMCVCDMSR